ncbi:MAG: TolC family protein [Gemmatimonadota bacterium]|nr:TolC family protein [Gemmatimonadota bacterium]
MPKLCYRYAFVLCGLIVMSWTTLVAETRVLGNARASVALTRFVQAVVDSNYRVQAARAGLEASSAFRDAASRPLYNPELSLDAENAQARIRTLSISQTLDWGGKRKARTAVAELDRLVAEAEYLDARWTVAVDLLNGLVQYQTGVARDRLAQMRQQLMEEFATLAQRQFEAGELDQVALDQALLSLTEARIQKAMVAADLAEARQAVYSLGPRTPEAQWPSLPEKLPEIPEQSADSQALVQALPGVVAARHRVNAADAVVGLQRRERRPDPTLSFTGGYEDGKRLIGLGLSISLPFRNRFAHEVTAAMAERVQAQQLADDAVQMAHASLISAAERYGLSRFAWDEWEHTGRKSLDRQSEQLRRLWQAGDLSTADYLAQLEQTIQVRESALDLHGQVWQAWFEWILAAGQVEAWLGLASR